MSRLTASISERSESHALAPEGGYARLGYARPFPVGPDEEAGHAHALRPAAPRPPSDESQAALPLLATAGDVREVVQYLKKRPGGVSVVEAMEDVRKRVFEPRKVAAYEFWGIVERAPGGDRLRLSALGWEFARKLAPEADAYRAVLRNAEPYRAALSWIDEQGLEVVTHAQVAEHWREHHAAAADGAGAKALEGSVVCFFHLCQAAELGTVTLGKRGQPARLRVERDELARHLAGGARPAAWPQPVAAAQTAPADEPAPKRPGGVFFSHAQGANPAPSPSRRSPGPAGEPGVFVSVRGDAEVAAQLRTLLELAETAGRVVERADADDAPVRDDVLRDMRRCAAALIVVTPEDCGRDEAGGHTLSQTLLLEISAAFVLYNRRVLLLRDERVSLPASLASLPQFSVGRGPLTWDTGVALLKAVKELKRSAARDDEDDDGPG